MLVFRQLTDNTGSTRFHANGNRIHPDLPGFIPVGKSLYQDLPGSSPVGKNWYQVLPGFAQGDIQGSHYNTQDEYYNTQIEYLNQLTTTIFHVTRLRWHRQIPSWTGLCTYVSEIDLVTPPIVIRSFWKFSMLFHSSIQSFWYQNERAAMIFTILTLFGWKWSVSLRKIVRLIPKHNML